MQAGAGLAVVAAYTVALVLALGGGDEPPRPAARADPARETGRGPAAVADGEAVPERRPLTKLERRIVRLVEDAPAGPLRDADDVEKFRAPRVSSVLCERRECRVAYSVGLPGRGRILSDQQPILHRLFSRTDVEKVTLDVVRDTAAAGVPAKSEETASGARLLTTICDRSRQRDVDWASATGAQILQSICKARGYSQGNPERQEPVAPDDPAAEESKLPPPSG